MGSYDRIVNDILPRWQEHFRLKNADYSSDGTATGDLAVEPHTVLGTRGQFADIWRKVWKLKKALWDGARLTGEQPEEILFDLIAHCFLTLDLLLSKRSAGKLEVETEPKCGLPTEPWKKPCDRTPNHNGICLTASELRISKQSFPPLQVKP